jgi:hypothetical protein
LALIVLHLSITAALLATNGHDVAQLRVNKPLCATLNTGVWTTVNPRAMRRLP